MPDSGYQYFLNQLRVIMEGMREGAFARAVLTEEELLTIRHCIVEAMEIPSEAEFEVRVGAPKEAGQSLLNDLLLLTSSEFWV